MFEVERRDFRGDSEVLGRECFGFREVADKPGSPYKALEKCFRGESWIGGHLALESKKARAFGMRLRAF